jgi:hypothetical protein
MPLNVGTGVSSIYDKLLSFSVIETIVSNSLLTGLVIAIVLFTIFMFTLGAEKEMSTLLKICLAIAILAASIHYLTIKYCKKSGIKTASSEIASRMIDSNGYESFGIGTTDTNNILPAQLLDTGASEYSTTHLSYNPMSNNL